MSDNPKDLSEILKGQLGIIALVVLLSGTVYIDAYYSQFGLKLASMNLSPTYVIYRGITAVLVSPFVAIPYIFSLLWIIADEMYFRLNDTWRWFRVPAAYVLVLFVLASSYPFAYHAGLRRAQEDMRIETSSLLHLISSDPPIANCEPDACRIVFVDSDSIYLLQPVPASQSAAVPNIRILSRKAYNEIITGVQ